MGQRVSAYERVSSQQRGSSRARASARSAGAALGVTFLAAVLAAAGIWLMIHWRNGEQALAAARDAEIATLRTGKKQLEHSLQAQSASQRELNMKLAAAESRLSELEQEHTLADVQLDEMRKTANQFASMIDSGQLEVSFRRGRMVVELPAQLLFPSGSADLTKEGSAALLEVAKILRDVRKRRFLVFGHTDSVPVASDQFSSNWELSVQRALHVTEALIAAGVPPQQLLAAGRAQYEPIASNATARGRQKNRRIEIVLEPQLVEPASTAERTAGGVDVD